MASFVAGVLFLDRTVLVSAVFAYLVWHGLSTLKDRVVPCTKLFVLPSVLLAWLVCSLVVRQRLSDIGLCLLFMAFGLVLGWKKIRSSPIWTAIQGQGDQWRAVLLARRKVALKGGKGLLVLSLLAFATRFYFGGYYTANPLEYTSAAERILDCLAGGGFAGFFWGRALCLCYALRGSGSVDL